MSGDWFNLNKHWSNISSNRSLFSRYLTSSNVSTTNSNNNNNNNSNNGRVTSPNGDPKNDNKNDRGIKKKTENPFAKFLISGSVTIFFEACAGGHYLEMIKILKQTSNDTYGVITKRMIAGKGIVGLLDGFMPWGALQSLVKGSSFGFGQAASLVMLNSIIPNGTMSDGQKMVLSGGLGGFTQGIVMSPMLLLKTRVMTDARFRTTGGFWRTSIHSLKLGRELIATEGGFISLTKVVSKYNTVQYNTIQCIATIQQLITMFYVLSFMIFCLSVVLCLFLLVYFVILLFFTFLLLSLFICLFVYCLKGNGYF